MHSNFYIRFTNMIYNRDKVMPFIHGVSGTRYKGFATHEQAAKFYLDAKEKGLVSIVRDPGDDKLFSPLRDTIQ